MLPRTRYLRFAVLAGAVGLAACAGTPQGVPDRLAQTSPQGAALAAPVTVTEAAPNRSSSAVFPGMKSRGGARSRGALDGRSTVSACCTARNRERRKGTPSSAVMIRSARPRPA